jgi:hypothetical protein
MHDTNIVRQSTACKDHCMVYRKTQEQAQQTTTKTHSTRAGESKTPLHTTIRVCFSSHVQMQPVDEMHHNEPSTRRPRTCCWE